jgi:hypothetical protein
MFQAPVGLSDYSDLLCLGNTTDVRSRLLKGLQALMLKVTWPDEFLAQCVSSRRECQATLKDDIGRALECGFDGGQLRGLCRYQSDDGELTVRLAPDGRVLIPGSCPIYNGLELSTSKESLQSLCRTIEYRRATDCGKSGFSFAVQKDGSFTCAFEICSSQDIE